MQSNLEKKLKETAKANPLTKAEKNMLWAKIENIINQKHSFQPFTFFKLKPKLVFASFMIIAIIGVSTAVAGASNDAGPGDLLYPIDIALERVQLALSREENKDNLRLKFAEERLKEAQRALTFQGNSNSVSITISTSTENNFKRIKKANKTLPIALERLEETREFLEQKGNEQAAEHVNDIIEKLISLAQSHVSDLDELEIKISNNNKIKEEVRAFSTKIKIKFKFNRSGNKKKAAVCHIPPDNPENAHTIGIAEPAVQAHLAHGDYLGECENGDQDNNNGDPTLDIIAPIISNIGSSVSTNTADITWDTDEESDSAVWYSTTTPIVLSSSLLIESADLVTSHTISLSGLSVNTTYYFVVGSLDSSDNKATSTESSFITTLTLDTIAPIISNIILSVSTNTVDITWDTDEESDSVVWYSTTTPLIISGDTLFVDSSSLVTTHNISLLGLNASTTYYFIVNSFDSSGNKATSIESSFIILTPDTTAPIISNISLSVSTNTADIIWNTDEPSNSKAWYSTTTPIVLGSSSFIESTNLVASHAVSLSSLNASTTYYFIVGSTDEFNNEATSTESSFTTL